MHLVIPYAAPLSEPGRHALTGLRLPHLDRLLSRWQPAHRDDGDETSLTPPHERARARALGLDAPDGLVPWAALEADALGLPVEGRGWAWITPVHWQVGSDQVTLVDPQALALATDEAAALHAAVRELLAGEGFDVHAAGDPGRWLACAAPLAMLATASIDRAIGRSIRPWLPEGDGARLVRRLQNEAQMLLHRHPVNDAREAAGALPVNSFWWSGSGKHQPVRPPADLQVDERLRAPALAEDWPAWSAAWAALDAGPIAALADATPGARLTLCGERSAVEYADAPPASWWQRLRDRRRPAPSDSLLASL